MAAKILVFSGSIRSASLNTRLAQAAVKILGQEGAEVTRISLEDYPLPLFDADLFKQEGAPQNALKLARLFQAHDGAFIASPEYNASIAPLLKNTLDWVSLMKSDGSSSLAPYDGLVVGLGSASTDPLGGVRGLYHTRDVLMAAGAQIITEQCSVAFADKGFGDDGMPNDEHGFSMLKSTCCSLMEHIVEGRSRA